MRAFGRFAPAQNISARFCATAAAAKVATPAPKAPPAIKSALGFGSLDAQNDIWQAADLPQAVFASNAKRCEIDLAWAQLDIVARKRLTPIALTATDTVYSTLRHDLASGKVKPVTFSGNAREALAQQKTVADLVNVFEAAMIPIRKLELERYDLQLEIYTLRDHINLGLKVFKQEQIDAKLKQLQATMTKLNENRAAHKKYVETHFDTHMFNDLTNVLRIAAGKHYNCGLMATRILEDMALCHVAFDNVTNLLMKNVVMGDGPHEDSGLLFAHVEAPERGEISLSGESIETVADRALETIARRHATPLTPEATKLRSTETHPNLQRSPE